MSKRHPKRMKSKHPSDIHLMSIGIFLIPFECLLDIRLCLQIVQLLPLDSKDSLETYDDYNYDEQRDEANKGGDSDDDDDDLDELFNEPISKGGQVDVIEGSTAILPCETTNMNGPFVWLKSNQMIFTTNIAIGSTNKKLQVADNHTLIIPDVNVADDQDTYTCQLYKNRHPLNITYQLQVHRKNRVQIDVVPDSRNNESSSSSSKNHNIDIGTSFRLECYAIIVDSSSGGGRKDQQQRIRWFKDGRLLPMEAAAVPLQSPFRAIFQVHKANRTDTGDYQCLIDNNNAHPLLQAVHVTVLYKPQISAGKAVVNAAIDYDTQLLCEYAGEPQPNVYWIRDDGQRLLADNRNRYEITDNYRNGSSTALLSLRIRAIRESDFGTYTCLATNRYGHANRTIRVTPKPAIVAYELSALSVRWTIESIAPISRYDLKVRQFANHQWIPATIESQPKVTNPEQARNAYILELPLKRIVGDLRRYHNIPSAAATPTAPADQEQLKFDLNLTVSNQFGSSTQTIANISAASAVTTITSTTGSSPDDRENMIFDQQEIVSTPSSATSNIIQSAAIISILLQVLVPITAATTTILC